MKIDGALFTVADWGLVPEIEHPGETGTSFWRVVEKGNVRARTVRYSEGFRSDHWCPRGHVLYVVKGDLTIALLDGTTHRLGPGMGFLAQDDESNPHGVFSDGGATVFIVD